MKISCLCAWRDCEASFQGIMPIGWRSLITFYGFCPVLDFSAPAVSLERDAMLCPIHVEALEGSLKQL